MQFLKNHYEKIILSLVLLGLVGAAVFLTIQVNNVQGNLATNEAKFNNPPNVPVPFRPLGPYLQVVQNGTNPPPVDLSSPHLVFSPLRWVLQSDGKLVKVDAEDKLGIGAVEITRITNQDYLVTFDRVSGSAESPRYQFSVERQGATDPRDRRKRSLYVSPGGKTSTFTYGETNVTATLKEVKGTPTEPTELVLELPINGDDGQPKLLTLGPGKPYKEVMNYLVDLKYPPENKTFTNVRVDDTLAVGMETYKVIAISEKQVTFEAVRNQKRMVIKYGAAP